MNDKSDDNSIGSLLQTFLSLGYLQKCRFLDSLIGCCGQSELSYLSGVLEKLIKIDFLSKLPVEVKENIIQNLDIDSLNKCRLVCRAWNDILLNSTAAYTVLLKDLGANPDLWTSTRNPVVIRQLYNDVMDAHLSLQKSIGIKAEILEGHSDRVCALHYVGGMLASASHDGTARVSDLKRGLSFERIFPCLPCISIRLTSKGLVSAQFDADLCFHPLADNQANLFYRGHTGPVHCLEVCEEKNLLISGSADWKVMTWKLKQGDLIRIFCNHSDTVVGLKLEEVKQWRRPYAQIGDFVLYSKDRNVCQVSRLEEPFNKMVVVKSLRSTDGHTFKHGLVVNDCFVVLNTRLKVYLWDKVNFELKSTVSCEHLLIPDLLGWGVVFGLLVDLMGLHVVNSVTGEVIYSISVSNLRKLERTYTRFIAGDVEWLDGFTGNDSSFLLYACAMNKSYNIEVTSWTPQYRSRMLQQQREIESVSNDV